MSPLTPAERDTLNEAAAILYERSTRLTSWMICAGLHNGKPSISVTYFDSNAVQHTSLSGARFADKVAAGIETEQHTAAEAEVRKARRIETLKAELAALELAA